MKYHSADFASREESITFLIIKWDTLVMKIITLLDSDI